MTITQYQADTFEGQMTGQDLNDTFFDETGKGADLVEQIIEQY